MATKAIEILQIDHYIRNRNIISNQPILHEKRSILIGAGGEIGDGTAKKMAR